MGEVNPVHGRLAAERLLRARSRELREAREQLQKQYDALVKRNARIELLNSVVEFAQQSSEFRPVMQRFVDVVCRATGWPVGHVYALAEDGAGDLVPLNTWHLEDPVAFEGFRRVTERTRLGSGEGLPGRVLAGRWPVWVPDVHADDNFPRVKAAPDIPVRAGLGVPVKVRGRVVAVAEFYTDRAHEEDHWLVEVIATTADQLGSLIERHEDERALDRANRELHARNEEMRNFVYTVSHDLRSPLVTMLGFVTLMVEDLRAGRGEGLLDQAGRVERAARKMERLIDDLLKLSRIGRTEAPPEALDLSAVASEVCDALSEQVKQAGAEVTVQRGMPKVWMDRARLRQLLENLLTNAIRYGCEGRDKRIEVGCEEGGKGPVFFVRDHGPGLAPEFHEKVFGLFHRLHQDNRGTGAGLAIVSRIVQLYGGRCWVESAVGEGASFKFSFPTGPDAGIMGAVGSSLGRAEGS